MYQPKTGQPCNCRPGVERDNCPRCEGTGQMIDFRAIHNRKTAQPATHSHTPGPWAASDQSGVWEIRAGQTRYCLATVKHAQPPFATNGDPDREAANARLMAAAPELAELLKDALAWSSEVAAIHNYSGRDWEVEATRLLSRIEGETK